MENTIDREKEKLEKEITIKKTAIENENSRQIVICQRLSVAEQNLVTLQTDYEVKLSKAREEVEKLNTSLDASRRFIQKNETELTNLIKLLD